MLCIRVKYVILFKRKKKRCISFSFFCPFFFLIIIIIRSSSSSSKNYLHPSIGYAPTHSIKSTEANMKIIN